MTDQPNQTQSLISKDFLAISENESVGSAIELLRKRKDDFQNRFAYMYVVDQTKKLIGVLRIRDLLTENPVRLVREIMKEGVARITEETSFNEILRMFRTHSYLAVPVTDDEGCLTGVIPADRLKNYIQPSSGEHLNRLMGFSHEEIEAKNPVEVALKRLPWLLISVTSGLVCAYIVGIFIGKIESIIALILFVPIILGLAGSVGTQSAAVTKRQLAEGNLVIKETFRVFSKEALVSLILGGATFLMCAAIALLWRKPPVEGIALGLSIVVVMIGSGLLGAILPLVFRMFRIPLNSASGLFLLLICDIFALILYFVISLSLVSPAIEIG